jgi:hypothetical protein
LNLFQEFDRILQDIKKSEENKKNGSKQSSITEAHSKNQFNLIDQEMTHLVAIKDILDELNILKFLIKEQKRVWHDAFSEPTTETKALVKDQKKVWRDAFSEYTIKKEYMNSRDPGDILETLEEMIMDATRVERSVSFTLVAQF